MVVIFADAHPTNNPSSILPLHVVYIHCHFQTNVKTQEIELGLEIRKYIHKNNKFTHMSRTQRCGQIVEV